MTRRFRGAGAGASRLLNIAMLLGGFGLGQGAIFIAQTWLVSRNDLNLLALFGTHFAFGILGVLIVDASGMVILAKHAVHLAGEAEAQKQELWRAFWEISIVRAGIALLMIAAILVYALASPPGSFARAYALFALPLPIIWAFNGVGLLDGLRMSGWSGITGSVPYLASAIGLVAAARTGPAEAGAILGAALTLGHGLTVVAQHAVLASIGLRPRRVRVSLAGIRRLAADALSMQGTTIPGQFYFRGQLLLCSFFLGTDATALLLYTKQIVAGVARLISFVRRVEFPVLVERLANDPANPLRVTLDVQRMGTYVAAVLTLVVLAWGLVAYATAQSRLAEAGGVLSVYAIAVLSSTAALTLTQAMAAQGRYVLAGTIVLIATVMAFGLNWAIVSPLGIGAFIVADVIQNVITVALALFYLPNVKGGK
jgi:hypothetical protein